MEKAFSGRFDFDGVELRKLEHQVKNKATGTPLVRCMSTFTSLVDITTNDSCIYTSHGAVFALLVST